MFVYLDIFQVLPFTLTSNNVTNVSSQIDLLSSATADTILLGNTMLLLQHQSAIASVVDTVVSSLRLNSLIRTLGYERVYLSLYKVADTLFHIQGDELMHTCIQLSKLDKFINLY